MQIEQRETESAIPYLNLSGKENAPRVLFSHANGYPPLCYRSMLEPLLSSFQVIAGLHRPLWEPRPEPQSLESWTTFGDDLIALVEQTASHPVIHLGHSMGAASGILAAAKRPELFRALVLIEPVIVPRRYILLLRLFSRLAPEKIPLVRTTLNRTDRWPSKLEAFEHFRPKRVFKNVSDQELWDYVEHGTIVEADGSCRLTYSKAWEAHCYTRVHNIWQALGSIRLPTLAIRASDSDTIFPAAWEKWQRLAPANDFQVIEKAGHLVPFEKPVETAETILRWLYRQRL